MGTQPVHHTTNLQTMCPANFRIPLPFDHNNFGHNHQRNFKVAASPIQVCAGHQAGAESAIHAMCSIFQEENTEGVLLIDASNAFNSLNRQVALHNIQVLCPRASLILINTYRFPSRLLITGGKELLSQEGTTQGDPLSMPFYAVSTHILIMFLRIAFEVVKQVWLADDASAAGKLV